MGLLDTIESSHRDEIRAYARKDTKVCLWRAFLVLFVVGPFAVVNFMFIPFAGQVLVVGAVIISVWYCILRRSFKLFLAGISGAAVSIVISAMIASRFGGQAGLAAYSLMALGAAVMISYNIAVIGAFWSLYEKAAVKIDESRAS